ncbi:MAG TPA: glutamine--tRNA ligase/YqeY domain fusion protein [Candidatus Ornithomonoglobus merdipullorum]|uniref:Glutamine--tRNA ligase n=1 Tax=Candidatus Ornithomonoglobus merdipullorum TaxID=2840895 RepID=A0A9D1MBF2_9FIRM|nr:glutamine--tRNA ligase/YqeY domain fusion protein [Candidatus Ornithomonoglobus merdipullorum]
MEEVYSRNFIQEAIDKDLELGHYDHVQTRFPPEPNGYLHIGHAKAICIDFGMAEMYGGKCNLRFDDTNPTKEDVEYVDSIMEDIKWLGFKWDKVLFASDYFDDIYEAAITLIKKGKAFVCDLSADEIREYRGTLTEPGKNSPYRDRTVEENLDLFKRMTDGEFPDGSKVLRAKIDMASPNLNMRDPVIYRILHAHHHRTGDKWCVYPMYDFAHPISDTVEGVTHSLCSLEFEDHRPLYDWVLKEVGYEHPSRQIEFARMNLNYTLTSKRRCLKLVREGIVEGWDDPRMSTLCGMRRRGYTPESIRDFCERIGVAKANSVIDFAILEACIREDLNKRAPRAMAVLDPIKLIVDNYPDDLVETFDVEVNPEDPSMGTRKVEFSKYLYIEREDFREEAPNKYKRMVPGREIRLKGAYYVTATGCEKDETGNITAVHCTYAPDSRGGDSADKRKVKGTIHFVSAAHAVDAEVRLYDRLFNVSNPSDETGVSDFTENLNPESEVIMADAKVESGLKGVKPGDKYQFMRHGYFCVDKDSTEERLVFNRTVGLKDSWSKISKAK